MAATKENRGSTKFPRRHESGKRNDERLTVLEVDFGAVVLMSLLGRGKNVHDELLDDGRGNGRVKGPDVGP